MVRIGSSTGSDMRNLDYYEVASQDLPVDSPEASRLLSIYPFPLAKRGYMTRLSQPLQALRLGKVQRGTLKRGGSMQEAQ